MSQEKNKVLEYSTGQKKAMTLLLVLFGLRCLLHFLIQLVLGFMK